MIANDQEVSQLNKAQLTDVQTKLKALGYYTIPVDGIFGQGTATAWARWKNDNNLGYPSLIGASSYRILSVQSKQPQGNPVEAVLKVARAEIGVVESPRGSNRQKYGVWYGMNGVPWCAQFTSWCYHMAGYPLPVIQDRAPSGAAYCPFIETYARRNNQWHRTPQPGDMALFHFGQNLAVHIGIVESVDGTRFLSIEGNTSAASNDNGGAVMRRSRNVSQCRGFYRPILAPAKTGFDAYYRVIRLADPLMQGNDIKEWQKQINYYQYGLDVDGEYGGKSEKACRDFQAKRGLEVDGIVGINTWRATFNV